MRLKAGYNFELSSLHAVGSDFLSEKVSTQLKTQPITVVQNCHVTFEAHSIGQFLSRVATLV